MRRHTGIPASIAVAVVWITSASALAQPAPIQVDEKTAARVKAREEMAARARLRSIRGMSNQLRPFYRYELMHARAACGLTKDQLREIRPQADAAYDRAIEALYEANIAAGRSRDADEPDYREAIHEAVASVVRPHVDSPHWQILQDDRRRRAASRKEAGVPLLVAILDRQLLLTGPQRQEITESLAAHWDDRWCDGLEAAFTAGSRWPAVPDEFVVPYLSPGQQETWHQVPRVRGRLWGVAIDHGGDERMEQDLGAKESAASGVRRSDGDHPPVARLVRRPSPAGAPPALPDVVIRQELVARRVREVEVMRLAPIAQPAPPPPADDDPDAEEDQAKRLQQQQLDRQQALNRRYQLLFQRQVFGGTDDEAAGLATLESALEKRLDELGRAGNLGDSQTKKLRAAGRGDIKRFSDALSEARETFVAALQGGGPVRMTDATTLRAERASLLKGNGPIFSRALARTLTDAQLAAIEKDGRDRLAFRHRADVRWTAVLLARSLGLLDDQRQRLDALLLERAIPPNKFDSHDYMDYAIVMYQVSRIPESDLRPIFDDVQWRVMRQELDAAGQWALYLRKGGFFDEKTDASRDGPLPPIHLLAPPPIQNRVR